MAAVVGNSDLEAEHDRFEKGTSCYNQMVNSRATRERATTAALHTSCDGCGLKHCSEVPAVSRRVTSGSRLMSGKSYIDALHVRAVCLYTKVRASRGRKPEDSAALTCEVCPCKRETLSHMIQQCPKSAHARNERHNVVAKLLRLSKV